MSKWVRLENNAICEIIPDAATQPSIAYWYGEGFAAQCISAPDGVESGWVYDPETGGFASPPIPSMTEDDLVPDYTAFVAGLMEGYAQ